jgi:hypothetical protein
MTHLYPGGTPKKVNSYTTRRDATVAGSKPASPTNPTIRRSRAITTASRHGNGGARPEPGAAAHSTRPCQSCRHGHAASRPASSSGTIRNVASVSPPNSIRFGRAGTTVGR